MKVFLIHLHVVRSLFYFVFCILISSCIQSEDQQIEKKPEKENANADNLLPQAFPLLNPEEASFSNLEAIIIRDMKNDIKLIFEEEFDKEFDKQFKRHSKRNPGLHPIVGINHRGWYQAPENTLTAFKESRQNGFDYVETDVRFTLDGIPVLLHEDAINRIARNADGTIIDNTISIQQITYEQALEYDFGIYKGNQFSGTKISRFDDFVVLCKSLNLHPFIEIKIGSSKNIASLVETVKKCGMKDHVTWISPYPGLLGYVKEYDEDASIGYIVEPPIEDSHISIVKNFKTEHNFVFIDSNYNLTEKDVQKCINANIPLMVWTVNSINDILSLDPYISGVTSNMHNAEDVFLKHNLP